MKSKRTIISLLASIICFSFSFAITPSEALSKAKTKLKSASSVRADFTMNVNGQTCSGKLITKGDKFALISNLSSTWYNGKDMWTYIPDNGETVITKPTVAEIAETNPLLYINYSNDYTVTTSKKKENGSEIIVLIPKKKDTGIRTVSISLNSATLLPNKIIITPASGNAVTVNIKNMKLNSSVGDNEFEYPKAKYPKAKIIDMR